MGICGNPFIGRRSSGRISMVFGSSRIRPRCRMWCCIMLMVSSRDSIICPSKDPSTLPYVSVGCSPSKLINTEPCPGGGFSMGTSYFYLEFLLAFHTLLSSPTYTHTKFHNPAILALEYTLVPQASYPTQLHQAIAGYKFLLSKTHDPSRVVFSGDSAGGTIILSLLLHIGNTQSNLKGTKTKAVSEGGNDIQGVVPALAVLISPWTTLISEKDRNTKSDYLDANNLHQYARQYVGSRHSTSDPSISPGNCKDVAWWRRACPSKGLLVMWGREEVFAPEIRDWVELLEGSDVSVTSREEKGGIHAWPVASLFLSSTKEERMKGLMQIVGFIGENMAIDTGGGGIIEVDGKNVAGVTRP